MSENLDALKESTLMACLQIGKRLTSTIDLDEILRLIMNKISDLVPAQNWSLLLLDQSGRNLEFYIAVGIDFETVKHITIPVGKGVAGFVAESGKPAFVEDVSRDGHFSNQVDRMTGFVTRNIICLPLIVQQRVLGVIEIINVDDLRSFKKTYLPLLSIFTDYAAIAIENARCFTQIQKLSITDEYTGLFNARYLHSILDDLLSNYDTMAVVFADIDNFKSVVDTYGHLAGSQVLEEIGTTLSGCLDPVDILIKYGGDEFIILLPGKDKSAARRKITTMLNAVRKRKYLKSGEKPVQVTASFGIAMYPDDASTKKELLLKADNLMYSVKRTTKNSIAMS
jgi:diguanylate cyclase (GGDEF)-like protein